MIYDQTNLPLSLRKLKEESLVFGFIMSIFLAVLSLNILTDPSYYFSNLSFYESFLASIIFGIIIMVPSAIIYYIKQRDILNGIILKSYFKKISFIDLIVSISIFILCLIYFSFCRGETCLGAKGSLYISLVVFFTILIFGLLTSELVSLINKRPKAKIIIGILMLVISVIVILTT